MTVIDLLREMVVWQKRGYLFPETWHEISEMVVLTPDNLSSLQGNFPLRSSPLTQVSSEIKVAFFLN